MSAVDSPLQTPPLQTLGLLGGMSWESTQVYYQHLNLKIKQHLGGLHSAPLLIHSVDFAPLEAMMRRGQWSAIEQQLCHLAGQLERTGAQGLAIATNTMHKLDTAIENSINIPLLHIADAAGRTLAEHKVNTVGLLGTAFTMQEDFYKQRLAAMFNIDTLVPDPTSQAVINHIIFEELCQGIIQPASKQTFLKAIQQLTADGADAVLLACTEIGLLVAQEDTETLLVDATHTHIKALAEFILSRHNQIESGQ